MAVSCGGGDDPTGPDGQPTLPTIVQEFTGNNQRATAGATLPSPLVVEVLNAKGEPVGGMTVRFEVVAGGGVVSPASAITNVSGQARTTFTLDSSAGAQQVRATVRDLPPITFTAMAVAPVPSTPTTPARVPTYIVVMQGMEQTAVAGMPVPNPVLLRVIDAQGVGVGGIPLTAAPAAGSGTFTLAAAVTNDAGEVSGSWQVGGIAGQQRVVITAPANGIIAPLTVTATVRAGPATAIVVASGNNQTNDAGARLAAPIGVRVTDVYGNVVGGHTVQFSGGAGGGTVSPTTVTTDAAGAASTAWTLGTAAGAQGAVASIERAAGGVATATFAATALAPSPATIRGLDHRVVDAEHAVPTNLIVTVSADPSRLTIIDPDAGTTRVVSLPQSPLSVSVNPAGTHAAVSHDGWLSYVNLASATLERVYPMQSVGGDVVLAGNGYAYVFPRADQWVSVRCLQLATGTETLGTSYGPYANARAKLHPSGDYIYSASNGLSPADMEKYDIRGGTAARLYDSPYHGDYPMGGGLWFSASGTRIFAPSNHVFRASTVRADDMTFAGILSGVFSLVGVVQNAGAPRVYVLGYAGTAGYGTPAEPIITVRAYESQFLNYVGNARLPKFVVPNGSGGTTSHQSEGRFLFQNAAGTRLYALVKAPAISGMALDWALATFEGSMLP